MAESSRQKDAFVASMVHASPKGHTPVAPIELAPGMYFLENFGNVGVVITSAGVVVIDTGSHMQPQAPLKTLRQLSDQPVHSIIYTHGHGDHAANTLPFLREAEERGDARPHVIGHVNVNKRFDRYTELHGQQGFINSVQFRASTYQLSFPPMSDFVRPDITYETRMTFQLGGLTFELHHAMGETDDCTWVYVPEQKVVFCGDLFISGCPNIGNPFKVQRYEVEWAAALEEIAALNLDVLSPGHGPVLRGAAINDALLTTAKALRYLHDEVVRRLNLGQWLEQIANEVRLPDELANHPALAPVYGCPAYIVRAIHRRYAGWYDGNPSHLSPSPTTDLATEVLALAGSQALLDRATALAGEGQHQMALHLLDFVIDGTQDSVEKRRATLLKCASLKQLAAVESSYISRSILKVSAERLQQEADKI